MYVYVRLLQVSLCMLFLAFWLYTDITPAVQKHEAAAE